MNIPNTFPFLGWVHKSQRSHICPLIEWICKDFLYHAEFDSGNSCVRDYHWHSISTGACKLLLVNIHSNPIWSSLKIISLIERINTLESFCFSSHLYKLHWACNSEVTIYACVYLTWIYKNVYLKWNMTLINTTSVLKSQNINSSIQAGTVHFTNVQCYI